LIMANLARVLLALLLAFVVQTHAVSAGEGQFEPLTLITKTGRHDIQVEVMRTEDERARGMMFRTALADDRGMLFDQGGESVANFWMKNTYISLDMVFIRADGTVHRIEEKAERLSTQTVSSGAPVAAVLELAAGNAARLGLVAGDKVEHPLFKPR
jgi:uncharacterized membrane protein (UPF0127 family)